MRFAQVLFVSLVFGSLAAGLASAHSPLRETVPGDQAVLATAPAAIEMVFDDGIRLTRVELAHPDHGEIELDLSGSDGFATDYSLPMSDLGRGTYRVTWRGLADDGHAMRGAFSFTVE
ncbi:MAG: copper resistance protein CopC [Pseudomonadota bacterium]